MENLIWLSYSLKATWSLRYLRSRSCFVPFLFLYLVVFNNIRPKIKTNRGNGIICFAEGKAWHLENQNEFLLAADWQCSFGGWVVSGRWPQLCSHPQSSAEPLLPRPEAVRAAGLHPNARILFFEKRKCQYWWVRAKLGNVNRSNTLCPASCCLC